MAGAWNGGGAVTGVRAGAAPDIGYADSEWPQMRLAGHHLNHQSCDHAMMRICFRTIRWMHTALSFLSARIALATVSVVRGHRGGADHDAASTYWPQESRRQPRETPRKRFDDLCILVLQGREVHPGANLSTAWSSRCLGSGIPFAWRAWRGSDHPRHHITLPDRWRTVGVKRKSQ